MAYCQYHPSVAASHCCDHCDQCFCPECLDERGYGQLPRCMICERDTRTLGVRADAEPFWRHIEASFKYPLKTEVIGFIIVISLMMTVSGFLFWPVMLAINLLATGALFKYCFTCLSETAMGNMKAPDITTAYQGGVALVFRLLFAVVLLVLVVILVAHYMGEAMASLVGLVIVVALPAMIVVYAMTESMAEALNPMKMTALMSAIGMPYLVLLGMLFIMFGSVEALSQLIGYEVSVVKLTLQSTISNFYSIVMFHLMGYMIFQYQHRLGYTAESDDVAQMPIRSEAEKYLAKLKLLVKQGRIKEAQEYALKAVQHNPIDKALNDYRFELMLALGLEEAQTRQAFDAYLRHLIRSHRDDKLYISYRRICQVFSKYLPDSPELRHQLAQACYQHGNPKAAVILVNGLHRLAPEADWLIQAYELMVTALEAIPASEAQIGQARKLVDALRQAKP